MSPYVQRHHHPAPRSLWIDRLKSWSPGRDLTEWLVEEANVRGYLGATGRDIPARAPDARLEDEDLIVALLSPHVETDGRVFKLVVRMIQAGKLDLEKIRFRARREKADRALYWLMGLVPESECNAPVRALKDALGQRPPRGYRPLNYQYDPARLVRRPARKDSLWRPGRS